MVKTQKSYFHWGGTVPLLGTTIPERFSFITEKFPKNEAIVSRALWLSAPCPLSLMTRVMDDMHCPEILIGYGQTEASPLTHLTARDDSLKRRTETVGKTLPHKEIKIVDLDTGKQVSVGKVGEICSTGYNVMKGYYGDSDAMRKAIDGEGWLHSGDLGVMDRKRYVKITGRLKEMIIRAGENIYPGEIEAFIFTHPKVSQVAVFGVPDSYYGEEVVAWVQLYDGETASEEEIRDFCKDKIAHFKIPRHIWFVTEFPMTVTGKVAKLRIREKTIQEMGLMGQQNE